MHISRLHPNAKDDHHFLAVHSTCPGKRTQNTLFFSVVDFANPFYNGCE
ncbi:hypothetical protein Krac_9304 [Ktedonobacter racemifer DSM 44963]|uniref:Uncharacterized protein n=1 Tax=Ktedonobacter racemifer DSM 44963 TaxID=485913 RepID=D6TBG0_KTERA|nr:hypothetical protein Krac_9304 [Ktedonobacter racemifer DSM 44963]